MSTLGLVRTPIQALGYGTFGANLELGLRQVGVDLAIPPDDDIHDIARTGAVIWALPASQMKWAWEGQCVAGYTMWESDRLPESFRDSFHNFDVLIVPCEQNRELFSRYHSNVVKIPLGYNADVWLPRYRHVEDEFRILCAGAGLSIEGGRKGFDIAVKVFQRAFPNWEQMSPRPRLVTKSLREPNVPAFVERNVGGLTEEELVEFVHGCHMYLGPSKGEGWGYWPQQALATGMPVVMSGIPAHMEYAHIPGIYTTRVVKVPADYFVYGPAGNWWHADIDQMAEQLWTVYTHYHQHRSAAARGAQLMREEFSHVRMAERVMSLMFPHLDSPTGPWRREFTRQVFPARVVRKVDADIGEQHYNLRPGEDYMLSADALRVLHDSGAITDDCLTDEPGLVLTTHAEARSA
jgi:hypothetical protein